MKNKKVSLFMLSAATALVLAACGGDDNATGDEGGDDEGLDANIVTIATGGASGPYNIIGSTLADSYSSEFGVNSRTQTTGASVENVNLIKEDKIEMAFTMSDVVSQAVEGTEGFDEPTEKISQIAALYPNY
ncbi:MAG TPA: TAXI family TRAP transporter solute-binding subunit, partial [Planococcus sp. (in: firmicutes)]|nr:TAXI family TRAP transporter solute-binding subunit [Planococcus sp. (in: firmicutes)]